jgi:hypothetical protein
MHGADGAGSMLPEHAENSQFSLGGPGQGIVFSHERLLMDRFRSRYIPIRICQTLVRSHSYIVTRDCHDGFAKFADVPNLALE